MKRALFSVLILSILCLASTVSAEAQATSAKTRAHQRFAHQVSHALYVAAKHTREPEEQLAYALSAEPKELQLAAQWTQRKWEQAEASYKGCLYKVKPPRYLAKTWRHYIAWQKRVIKAGFNEVASLEAQDWQDYQQAAQRTNSAAKHREIFFKRLRVQGN